MVNHLYTLFLRSSKTNTKCYNKKRKKSVTRNITASKKYCCLIFIRLDLVVRTMMIDGDICNGKIEFKDLKQKVK